MGGDIPYGCRGHVLTQAERKEYPTPSLDKKEPNSENIIIVDDERDLSKLTALDEPMSLKISGPPSADKRPSPPPAPEPVVRISVIQRAPITVGTTPSPATSPAIVSVEKKLKQKKDDDKELTLPVSLLLRTQQQKQQQLLQLHRHPEPEQEQPIDYHIPKRRDDTNREDDETEKKTREARRKSAIIPSSSLLSIRNLQRAAGAVGKIQGIMSAAAGHGRSSNNNSQGSQGNSGNQSNGGSNNFNGSSGGSSSGSGGNGGGGAIGGGSGAGGGMGGRDGRSNYGPNSPPTGSLPPFYESLKGGNGGMNGYNANGNFIGSNGYNNLISANISMDCDTTQELTNIGGYSDNNSNGGGGGGGGGGNNNSNNHSSNNNTKQYSMLQNAYGLVLKDEQDLDYDSKIDPLSLNSNLLQGGYGGYDVNDSMMVDMGGVGVVDPLQFTATLTFSSPSDHALLDSLSDAVDLSQFLQRLPNDDQPSPGNDLELSSTPSLTPDSVSITPVDGNCLEPFPEQFILSNGGGSHRDNHNNYDNNRNNGYNAYNKYHDNPPSYQASSQRDMHHQMMQQQQQQQQHHQDHQSIGNGFDLDSHSNLSLPSPGGGSSLDGSLELQPSAATIASTIQNVSVVTLTRRGGRSCDAVNAIVGNKRAMPNTTSNCHKLKKINKTESPPPPILKDAKVHVLQERVSIQKFQFLMILIIKLF